MFKYVWPIALAVISNTLYHVCAKSVPDSASPFAALTVTYLTSAAAAFILYFAFNRGGSLLQEYHKLNWSSVVLGLAIAGLEVGFIFAYKAGWSISTAQVVQGGFLALALIFVGYFFFNESLSWNKIVGIFVCLAGLFLINYDSIIA